MIFGKKIVVWKEEPDSPKFHKVSYHPKGDGGKICV